MLSVVPSVLEPCFCLQGQGCELKHSEKDKIPTKESIRTYDESRG
jgi:hypothetical protein